MVNSSLPKNFNSHYMHLLDTDATKHIRQRGGFCGFLWEQKTPTHKTISSHVVNVVAYLITKFTALTIFLMVYTIIQNICIIQKHTKYIPHNIDCPKKFNDIKVEAHYGTAIYTPISWRLHPSSQLKPWTHKHQSLFLPPLLVLCYNHSMLWVMNLNAPSTSYKRDHTVLFFGGLKTIILSGFFGIFYPSVAAALPRIYFPDNSPRNSTKTTKARLYIQKTTSFLLIFINLTVATLN